VLESNCAMFHCCQNAMHCGQLGEAMAGHWQSVCAQETLHIWQVCASVARSQVAGLAWESSNSHQQPPSSYQAPAAEAFPQPPPHSQQPAAANGWGAADQVLFP
jgi:hypothetical protein